MKQPAIKMIRKTAVCKDCGHKFTIYTFSDFEYGRKPAKTPVLDDFAYIDCLHDPVCKEVSSLVDEILRGTDKKDWQIADCFDLALSAACDPAPSGHEYSFTGMIWCPKCGSTNVDYGPDIPYKVETVHVPHVTHTSWQRLTEHEKRERLREALRKAGCLS